MNAPDERFELTGFRCAAAPVPAQAAPAQAAARPPATAPVRVDIGTIRIDLPAAEGGAR
jgi:hypothetical protein